MYTGYAGWSLVLAGCITHCIGTSEAQHDAYNCGGEPARYQNQQDAAEPREHEYQLIQKGLRIGR